MRPASRRSADMRRFELASGSAAKFWEIAAEGTSTTVRFGRIGCAELDPSGAAFESCCAPWSRHIVPTATGLTVGSVSADTPRQ